ncbi:MAG: hypothetical protein IJW21_03315 [Clostridia bacterium]|nr:hypothetical protein [Clostridia bacterium]
MEGKLVMFNAILSLIFLVAAIAIGCVLKKNTGIVSIALALILARITGISDKTVIGYFNSSLFIMLLGIMFLFCIAQNNHTLELLARGAIRLCCGRVKLIPIVLFVLGAIISAIGPGLISTTALMSVLAMALAIESKVEPIKFLLFGALGSFAGTLSPITPSGIVAITKAEESGIFGIELPIALLMFLVMLFCAVILYFFIFRWHKYKENFENKTESTIENDKFKIEHICTLLGIVVVAVLSTVFDINIGLISFAVAVVLLICGFADEGAAIKAIPWNTLLMITGVGVLISLVTDLGGIDLLSDLIRRLMGEKTAAAIITILAGVMSWVSSASGVVMPTLIPTVPTLMASLPGANPVALVTGICIGANAAAFSPLSSCGGLMLAAYSGSSIATNEGRNKMFARLFFFSAACIGVSAIFALLGCFGWFSA